MLLSRRQFAILRRIAQGMSHEDIGNDLGVGARTIRAHMGVVYQKLQLGQGKHCPVLAALWWKENGECQTWEEYLRFAAKSTTISKEIRWWPIEERTRVQAILDDVVFEHGTITRQQLNILVRIAAGDQYKQIADAMNIAVRTVKFHIASFFDSHPELERTQQKAILWWAKNGSCKSWEEYVQFEAANKIAGVKPKKIVLIK